MAQKQKTILLHILTKRVYLYRAETFALYDRK